MGWRYVTSGAGVQPQLAERLFSHLTICGPLLPCSRETSPFGTPPYATSPFYDRARGPTSRTSQRGVTTGVTGAVASEGARSVVAELAPMMWRFNVISGSLVGYYARS